MARCEECNSSPVLHIKLLSEDRVKGQSQTILVGLRNLRANEVHIIQALYDLLLFLLRSRSVEVVEYTKDDARKIKAECVCVHSGDGDIGVGMYACNTILPHDRIASFDTGQHEVLHPFRIKVGGSDRRFEIAVNAMRHVQIRHFADGFGMRSAAPLSMARRVSSGRQSRSL